MFSHDDIWTAIDALAKDRGYSASGLARQAGLDPTSFNRSKRVSPSGKPRWPSTESLAKILAVTDCSLSELLAMAGNDSESGAARSVPMMDMAGLAGGRNPAKAADGAGQKPITAMAGSLSPRAFAVRITDKRFEPLYRKGVTLIVDPDAAIDTDDRVLFFSRRDGLVAGIVTAGSKRKWTIAIPGTPFQDTTMTDGDTAWTGRIVLATQ